MRPTARGLLLAGLLALSACRASLLDDRPAAAPAAGTSTVRVSEQAPRASGGVDEAAWLSVEEALLLAIQNNRDLRVRRYEPRIVGAFEVIEMGVFDPELFASVITTREEARQVSRSTRETFGVNAREATTAVGVRKRFISGTDVELALEYDAEDSNRAPKQKRTRLGLTVTQALLRGRGPAVNLAGVRQADAATVASRFELRGFVEALLADTKIAYWRYVLAREEERIFQRSLEVAEQQLADIEEQIDVGALPASEAAAARTEVAVREQALINARGTIEERRLRLLKLIGPPTPEGFARPIEPTTDPTTVPEPLEDVEDRIVLALRARPDLNEARARYRERSLETVVTRDGLRPKLDFFFSLGKTGYSDALIESFTNLDGNTYDMVAGLEFTHKPVDRSARARHMQAWAARLQAAAAIRNLESVVRLDVLLAANEVERTRKLITASARTRKFQAETAQAERERFAVGSSTTLLVAQAQRDLLQAEIAEVEAIVNYRIALVRLYLAEGTMLERHGIVAP